MHLLKLISVTKCYLRWDIQNKCISNKDRLRFGIKNMQAYFVFLSTCTIFARFIFKQNTNLIKKNMKKIIVSMLLLLPFGLIAQEMKIAIVNQAEIFNLLPETSALESEIATLQQTAQKEMKSMEDEYLRKYSDLQSQNETLTENIKKLRLQELEDIQARMQNFAASAQENMEKRQEELLMPIREKIQKAVTSVGEENGYTYILNPQVVLYKGNSAIDATEKVKAKLGLK